MEKRRNMDKNIFDPNAFKEDEEVFIVFDQAGNNFKATFKGMTPEGKVKIFRKRQTVFNTIDEIMYVELYNVKKVGVTHGK